MQGGAEDEAAATAILVLGAAVWPGGRPSPTLARRTAAATRLYRAGAGALVVPCGGLGRHAPSEAEAMRRLLVADGVPETAILREDRSTTTGENIRFARALLAPRGLDRVIVVTDAYHLPRALLLARRAGFDARGVAPPLRGARPATLVRGALREIPAYAAAVLGLRR